MAARVRFTGRSSRRIGALGIFDRDGRWQHGDPETGPWRGEKKRVRRPRLEGDPRLEAVGPADRLEYPARFETMAEYQYSLGAQAIECDERSVKRRIQGAPKARILIFPSLRLRS